MDKKIVFFDGDCAFCNSWVKFLLKHDIKKQLYFAPLQGETASKLHIKEAENLGTLVFYSEDSTYIKSDAVFEIIKELGLKFKILLVFSFLPKVLLDFIYDLVSKNRHKFVKTRCKISSSADNQRILF